MWYLLLLYSCNLCVLPFTVVYYSFIENEYFLAFNYAFKKRLHFLSLSCFVVVNQYSFFFHFCTLEKYSTVRSH